MIDIVTFHLIYILIFALLCIKSLGLILAAENGRCLYFHKYMYGSLY